MEYLIKLWELILVIALAIFMGFAGYHTLATNNVTIATINEVTTNINYIDQNHTYFMMEDNRTANGFVDLDDGYMCIITQNRSYEEILETFLHEVSHIFCWNDPEHFCGRWMK